MWKQRPIVKRIIQIEQIGEIYQTKKQRNTPKAEKAVRYRDSSQQDVTSQTERSHLASRLRSSPARQL